MIAKKYRFHGRKSLNSVYKYGLTYYDKDFSIKSLFSKEQKNPRVAVVVSKKVSKKATQRNKIRRKIYEIIRLNIDTIKPPQSLIISVFKEDILKNKPKALEKKIVELIKKANNQEDKNKKTI